MCGIAGVLGWTNEAVLAEMLDDIEHRGPDEEGRLIDEDANLMMGARRLSIVDIEGGSQPVFNEDGTVAVAFNGEIYNHAAIRDRLRAAGHRFRSDCDTEVLVHLWEAEGTAMLETLDGMFAFSLWDATTGTLLLGRDRLGIKPLYYARTDTGLVWGSELTSLLTAGVDRTLDPAAVYNYFRLEYTPWPQTLLSSVRKVPPGGVAVQTPDGFTVRRYWTLPTGRTTTVGSRRSAARQLRSLLETSVEKRLMADVPVGAFLSGGLDSSAVTGLMAQRTDELETFSVAFPGEPYDESADARFVAEHFGTTHHEVDVRLGSLDELDELVSHLSEPPSHTQVLPILALSRLARSSGVKVALAGEGADELFGGYSRYRTVRRARPLVGSMPAVAYGAVDALASVTPVGQTHLRYVGGLRDGEHALLRNNCGFDCTRPRPAAVLDTDLDDEQSGLAAKVREAIDVTAGDDAAQQMMTFDLVHLLPDSILLKTDHASMAASLEVRVPFLDHHLVSFAHQLPVAYRVTPGDEKAILKQAVADVVPQRIRERKKYGMGIPVDSWFRSDHDVIARWLAEERLAETPYVDPVLVHSLWDDHRRGRTDDGRMLWTTLSFVAWYHGLIADAA